MFKKNLIGAVLMVLFLAGTSYAQDAPEQSQGAGAEHSHRAPSQASIDACSGKSEGDGCSFTTPHGKNVSGSCSKAKDGQTMFCKRVRKQE
jgi:hypothetical protein